MKIRKYVASRYNVRASYAPKNGQTPLGLTSEWLSHRRHLFERYCVPSLIAQTDGDWTFLLCVDAETPKEEIDAISAACGRVKAAILPVVGRGVRHAIKEFIDRDKGDASVVTTTRLDNDDALGPDYMRWVQHYASAVARSEMSSEAVYLSFRQGQQFIVGTGQYRLYSYPENAFGTLIELGASDLATVYATHHARMIKTYDTVLLSSMGPQWCMIIHDQNISNDARGELSETPHFLVGQSA